MKTGSLATKLMLAAVLLTVLVYFGVNAASYFMDPFTTTLVYDYVSENAVSVSGYVVRQEEILTGGSGDLVYFSRGEGEKVSRGGTVALVYQSAQSLQDANTLRSLEEQLDQLIYAQSLASGASTTARLDEEVVSSLIAFRGAMATDNLSAAEEPGDTLRSAILKRSFAFSGTEALETTISSLQQQISTLTASAGAGTTAITAPSAGLFSSMVDGYESVLLPENLAAMTPTNYRAIAPQAVSNACGKMIYGTSWSFVTMMRTEDLGKLAEGNTVKLRFQNGLNRDITMTVTSISKEEGGQKVVVLSTDSYLNLTTLLRHQNAQIIFNSYSGLRVPRSAVRILTETVTDEDGTELTEKTTGVYCLWGSAARFKPVDIVWQEDSYILVTPAEGATSTRTLRAGDEVITAAEDLYDGKVVNQ